MNHNKLMSNYAVSHLNLRSCFSDFKCTQWRPHEEFGHTRNLSFQHPIKIYLGVTMPLYDMDSL